MRKLRKINIIRLINIDAFSIIKIGNSGMQGSDSKGQASR